MPCLRSKLSIIYSYSAVLLLCHCPVSLALKVNTTRECREGTEQLVTVPHSSHYIGAF